MEQVPSRTIQHRSFGTAVELALTLIQGSIFILKFIL